MIHTVEIHDLAHGGDGVGRLDGKVIFVPGTIAGEIAQVEIVDDRADFAKARLVEIIEPSPHRVQPLCPHFDACGGCQWQFFDRARQADAKRNTLVGQLQHLGRVDEPPVEEIVMPGPAFGYRNRMDFSVSGGRPALAAWRSRDLVGLDECLLLSPVLAEVFENLGDLGRARSVTLRCAEATGDVLVVLTGRAPGHIDGWGVPVVRPDGRSVVGGRVHLTELVGEASYRITAGAFFQNNTHGAAALVEIVADLLNVDRSDRLLDAYAGVGLFGCTVGRRAGSVICVEAEARALADLEYNLEDNAVPAPEILVAPFEDIEGESWTVAVVDPPRSGLRRPGVVSVTAARPRAIAYVSCDPASLARDTRYLDEQGYDLRRVVPVDMFPQTYHLEAVALFEPSTGEVSPPRELSHS